MYKIKAVHRINASVDIKGTTFDYGDYNIYYMPDNSIRDSFL